MTRLTCPEDVFAAGGEWSLHPLSPETDRLIETELRGRLTFDHIAGRHLLWRPDQAFLPQLDRRSSHPGQLDGAVYGVRAHAVVSGRPLDVLSADGFRELVGLEAGQRLVLMCFGTDRFLERSWAERHRLARRIARAGYDLVVAPSFSTYTPRPRPEHLVALARSMEFYDVLCQAGVTAAPRLGWAVDRDAERLADWSLANSEVSFFGVDMGTLRSEGAFASELALLRLFDRLTGGRSSYLVNGPSTEDRIRRVLEAVGGRAVVTNARQVRCGAIEDRQDRAPEGYRPYEARWRAVCRAAKERAAGASFVPRSIGGGDREYDLAS